MFAQIVALSILTACAGLPSEFTAASDAKKPEQMGGSPSNADDRAEKAEKAAEEAAEQEQNSSSASAGDGQGIGGTGNPSNPADTGLGDLFDRVPNGNAPNRSDD